MKQSPIIVWIRHDLRLNDNPALFTASEMGRPIICLYIDDTETDCKHNNCGGAARWWNHYALHAFTKQVEAIGGVLTLRSGNPQKIIDDIISETDAEYILWNRLYTPDEIKRDSAIKKSLMDRKLHVQTFAANLLVEPHTIINKEGSPYKVYSPFRRAVEGTDFDQKLPYETVKSLLGYKNKKISSQKISDIFPLPRKPDWGKKLEEHWDITEDAALERVKYFVDRALEDYKKGRDFPAKDYVSRLSPYLARGLITSRKILDIVKPYASSKGKTHFISELLWREFASYLLYHFPYMTKSNFRPEWDKFPWENDPDKLKAWQKGMTGYPIVDAAMRELRKTGYMHNRSRMLVGSFLVKNLLIDWKYGEKWFRDNLVDFDVASNIASWQWVAGSGADAAPYFRIFNPILQSKKFDEDGEYIKTYVPELSHLSKSNLHEPFNAPPADLMMQGVQLGKTYPHPICDLQKTRERALEIYQELKKDT